MDNIRCNSSVLVVTQVLKKTRARGFNNLSVGSRLLLYVDIERAGIGPSGNTYASYVCLRNEDTGEETGFSFNEIAKYIACFSFTEEQDV